MIMRCQCRFIDCRKCTTLTWDVDSRGVGSACKGAQNIWEILVLSAQSCCDPKRALKIKSIFKNVLLLFIKNLTSENDSNFK